MTPLALRVTNFRSARDTLTFCFPDEPGLYFLQGANEHEPRLGANGAGKSTVWDALTWCWFGKTSRGLKAGDVCNWDAGKGTVVEFDFVRREDRGSHAADLACVYTMRRTWSPNSWTLLSCSADEEVVDLAKEKDNPALAWLGLEFEPWLACVLAAQRAPMFLDLKRDAQAALFSTVLGLDRWLECSASASKAAGEQDRKIRDAERELSRLEGELAALGRRDLREDIAAWERARAARLRELEDSHAEAAQRRRRAKAELVEAQEREENARAQVSKAQPDVGLEKDYRRAKAYVGDYTFLLAEQQGAAAAARSQLARMEEATDCPVCGQRLGSAHRAQEGKRLARELRDADAKVAQYQRELEASILQAAGLGADHKAQADELEEARSELDRAQRAASGARRAVELLDRDLDALEESYDRAGREDNPYAGMEAREREERARMASLAEETRAGLDDMGARHALLSYWVRGFKDVRLSLIAEALTELEVEVNSCCDALGLVGWELEFRVDRETKGGGLARGFDCFVRSPHNDQPVPWAAWSGGETQRLLLAGNMGFADLVRSRTGATIPLEVWDEPTEGLSPQGIRDLLECLKTRAEREGRCIWLVDHRAHDFGGFAGGAVVTKTARGSAVERV